MGAPARLQTKKKTSTAVRGQPAPTGGWNGWMGGWMESHRYDSVVDGP